MEKLFYEIESTIDQLISNAQVLHRIAFDEGYADESDALRKMQESLLCRLIERDQQLEAFGLKDNLTEKFQIIEEKLSYFSHLNHQLVNKTFQHYSKS
ncbi:MAG: hypothetical protein KDK44_04480 [Chlamydiia bacterium]|nr:hypothetical protein [Chlamydiia bacterium]